MSKFKIGDRVVYNKGKADEDFGTILRSAEEYSTEVITGWWIKWDSDGNVLWCEETHLQAVESPQVESLPDELIINGVRYLRAN